MPRKNDLGFTWDDEAQAGYLKLSDGKVACCVASDTGSVVVDYDRYGQARGVEVLGPKPSEATIEKLRDLAIGDKTGDERLGAMEQLVAP